jgi:AAA15 family ATPase/GTPase
MLKDLTIQNYRIFDSITVEPITRVNLIVGANNCGKTTLLEAIYLLSSKEGIRSRLSEIMEERGEFLRVSKDYSERLLKGYHLSQIFYKRLMNLEQKIEIRSKQEEPKYLRIYLKKSDKESSQSLVFESEEKGKSNLHQTRKISQEGFLLEDENPFSLLAKKVQIHEQIAKLVTTKHYDFNILAELWDKITLTAKEDHIVKALQILEPEVERLNFQSQANSDSGILLKLKNSKTPISLGSMGDGMRRILTILANLVNVENGILLVDEIDTGLYYHSLTEMWRLILDISLKHNTQVFATTHSWDCVKAFQQALDEMEYEAGCLIRLEKKDKHFEAISYSKNELDIAIHQNIEVR